MAGNDLNPSTTNSAVQSAANPQRELGGEPRVTSNSHITVGLTPPRSPRRAIAASKDTVVVEFEALAKGQQEIVITFRGETYRVRRTRNNKLIMTK